MKSRFRIYDGPKTCETDTCRGKDGVQRVIEWIGLDESNNHPRPPRVINRQGGYICHCLDVNTHVAGALARLFDVTMFYANRNGPLNRTCIENNIPAHIGEELRYAATSELFDGFILYQAAGIMEIDENGRMHTSANLEQCVKANWRS